MTSDSQRSIIFMPYDPLAPKAKRKARESTMTAMTTFSKSNALLVAEDSGMQEIRSPSEDTEQQQICIPEPPVDMLHSKGSSTSNPYQHSVAVLEKLGDTAPVLQGSHQDVDAGPAHDGREGEGSLDAADTQLIVEGSIEVFPGPVQTDSDADCSLADVADRLQRCKRARSHPADGDIPLLGAPCSSPRLYSTRARSGKRKKPSRGGWIDTEPTAPCMSPAPCRENDHSQVFPREEIGHGDSDVSSSESSDLEGRLEINIKKQLLHGTVPVPRPRLDRYSTTEVSEIGESANEDDRVDSEVVEGSRVSSARLYRRHNEVLSAAPQQCHHTSIEKPCRTRPTRREKRSITALRKNHLCPHIVQLKAKRASIRTIRDLEQQRCASLPRAVAPCDPIDDHKAPRDLFEISGLSSHFKQNSDTVVAHLRALEPHSLTAGSIPGLEAFGSEFQTVHWVQRTQESWLLIGFRDRTEQNRGSIGSESGSHTSFSRDSTDLEPGRVRDSSVEDDHHGADGVRGLSSREPWKKSDDYRLLSYIEKERLTWDEVFERFPSRSAGAVRTHYHNLLKKKK